MTLGDGRRDAHDRERRHGAGQHDDACSPPRRATRTCKVASVTNFAAGAPLTIGAQTVTITTVGTAAGAATTLFAPAAAGDTNIKVSSSNGFVAGQPALVESEVRTVTDRRHAGPRDDARRGRRGRRHERQGRERQRRSASATR